MKRFIVPLLAGLLLISADSFARGSSSSVSKPSTSSRPSSSTSFKSTPAPTSSRQSSSSIISSKPATPAPAPVTPSSSRQSSSTIISSGSSTPATPPASLPISSSRQSSSTLISSGSTPPPPVQGTPTKAVAPSALTQQMQKAGAIGATAYGSQMAAQSDLEKKKAEIEARKSQSASTSSGTYSQGSAYNHDVDHSSGSNVVVIPTPVVVHDNTPAYPQTHHYHDGSFNLGGFLIVILIIVVVVMVLFFFWKRS
jgi:hypothetical protein